MSFIDDFESGKIEKAEFLTELRKYITEMEKNHSSIANRLKEIAQITGKNSSNLNTIINKPEPVAQTVSQKAPEPKKSAKAIFTQIFEENPGIIIQLFGFENTINCTEAWNKAATGENKSKLQKFLKESIAKNK